MLCRLSKFVLTGRTRQIDQNGWRLRISQANGRIVWGARSILGTPGALRAALKITLHLLNFLNSLNSTTAEVKQSEAKGCGSGAPQAEMPEVPEVKPSAAKVAVLEPP